MIEKDNSTPNAIEIEGKEIQKIIYKGEPVVTLAMVDEFHGRPEGTAKRNFIENKDKLILGEDYFEVPYVTYERILAVRISYRQDSLKRNMTKSEHGCHRGNIVMLTMTGYMMLVKSFTDDLAWKIQRKLVTHYFNAKMKSFNNPNLSLDERLKMLKKEQKKIRLEKQIMEYVVEEAENAIENGIDLYELDAFPNLKTAIASEVRRNPRYEQLNLFE